MHTCVGNLTNIGSDNGLSPGRRQAMIRANAVILLIRPLGTSSNDFLIESFTFWLKKIRLCRSYVPKGSTGVDGNCITTPSLKFSYWEISSLETEMDEDDMIFIMAHIVWFRDVLIYRLNMYDKLNFLETNKTHASLNVHIYDYMIGNHETNHRRIYVSFVLAFDTFNNTFLFNAGIWI